MRVGYVLRINPFGLTHRILIAYEFQSRIMYWCSSHTRVMTIPTHGNESETIIDIHRYSHQTVSRKRCIHVHIHYTRPRIQHNLGTYTRCVHCIAPNSRSYNYIFKVLFTTPSWYLFSIGFGHILAFRWNLAPFRIPVQRNITLIVYTVHLCIWAENGTVTLTGPLLQIDYTCTHTGDTSIYNTSLDMSMVQVMMYSVFIRND